MPTIEIENTSSVAFGTFTRVYKTKGSNTVKRQSITLNLGSIMSVRASNRLGMDNHRSTVLMADGTEYELADVKSTVDALLADAFSA